MNNCVLLSNIHVPVQSNRPDWDPLQTKLQFGNCDSGLLHWVKNVVVVSVVVVFSVVIVASVDVVGSVIGVGSSVVVGCFVVVGYVIGVGSSVVVGCFVVQGVPHLHENF